MDHAERCLAAGRDFLVTSVGAVTDDALFGRLQCTASPVGSQAGRGGQLLVAAGAMPAVDWMGSASLGVPAEDITVRFTQTKPPKSWIGARYDPETKMALSDVIDFARLTEKTTFFCGSAREAAAEYPKNSNIAAMLALATGLFWQLLSWDWTSH